MLNKKICWRCENRQVVGVARHWFDRKWDKKHLVLCPYVYHSPTGGPSGLVTDNPISVIKAPPEHCVYFLEHIVNAE